MTQQNFTGIAAALSLVAIVALAGCARPDGGRRAGLTATQAAECRQRSEDIYRQQNRADIYRSDTYATSTRDSPFSNAGLPGITSQGLGSQFGREKALNDCYNASGAEPASGAAAPTVK